MPWVRFDDQFPIHRKVWALPGNAPGDAVKATDQQIADVDAVSQWQVMSPEEFRARLLQARLNHVAAEHHAWEAA